jgi:squalene-hopene/tetraprenyl-beta-curcumene cyclase
MHVMKASRLVCCFAVVVCGILAWAAPGEAAETPTPEQVRQTIAKSLPFIAEKGEWWIEEKKCVSCHRVSFMTWSLSAAKRKGFEVDAQLPEWQTWSVNMELGTDDKGVVKGTLNLDGLGQMLMARDETEGQTQETEYAKFVELIVQGQQANGTWKPGGQLPAQKRPQPETTAVFTMWNTLSLANITEEAAVQSRAKALEWIKKAPAGESQEWFVTRLLIDQQFGTTEQTALRIQAVKDRQNTDGGWGWKMGDPSDALATGQTLYALRKAGLPADDPIIAKGQKFLIETQREDGSWSVPGTKTAKKGQPAETSNYWGTCWAAIGLLETLSE